MAVKYKPLSGSEASESGFDTKQSALDWGRDQEAKIRAGTWTDLGDAAAAKPTRPQARSERGRHRWRPSCSPSGRR